MKKLQILTLLMFFTSAIYSSDSQNYQATLTDALNRRAAGEAGYESGSDNMRAIRDPRRADVGLDQEANEYFTTVQATGGANDTPVERFVNKIQTGLNKVAAGTMTPDEFNNLVQIKLNTYNKKQK